MTGFPAQFQLATKRAGADAIICTHNDADHTNGIIGFLQSGLRCKEVWLPGSWTDRLRDLFRPDKFTRELAENVKALGDLKPSDTQEGDTLLEQTGSRNQREGLSENRDTLSAD